MPDTQYLLLFVGILLATLVLTIYICRSIFQKRLHRQFLEAAALMQQRQTDMLQAALRIRDQALAFMGWELHEETCQVLAMAGTLLLDAVGSSNDQVKQQKAVQAIAERLFTTTKELKHIAEVLKEQEQTMQTDLVGFIEQQVAFIGSLKTSKIKCDFNHVEFEDTIPPYPTLLLCCVVQDALKYILRQTNADVVHIDLSSFNASLYLVLLYNGKEFNQEGAYSAKTEIIRKMAAIAGATMSFETSEHLCNKMTIKMGNEEVYN